MTSSSPKKHPTTCPPPRTSRDRATGGHYDPDAGWVLLPAVLTNDDVAVITAACTELLALDPTRREPRDKPAGGTRHLGDLRGRAPLVDELVTCGRLWETVTDIIGADGVVSEVGYRCPRPGHVTQYLHADAAPKADDGPDQVATAIVMLCEFTSTNGATRLVPGSHRRPDLQRLSGRLEAHDDEVRVTGPPGSAVVFSGHLLHSGTTNESTRDRPALQITWSRHPNHAGAPRERR